MSYVLYVKNEDGTKGEREKVEFDNLKQAVCAKSILYFMDFRERSILFEL